MSLLTLSRNVRMINGDMAYQSNELMNGMLMFVFYSEPWFSILCRAQNRQKQKYPVLLSNKNQVRLLSIRHGNHIVSEIEKEKVPSVGHFLFIIAFILWLYANGDSAAGREKEMSLPRCNIKCLIPHSEAFGNYISYYSSVKFTPLKMCPGNKPIKLLQIP